MIATQYPGVFQTLVLFQLGLVALGFLSLRLAYDGRWSALFFAAPPIFVGGVTTWSFVLGQEPIDGVLKILFPAPLVLGLASVALLWLARRAQRLP